MLDILKSRSSIERFSEKETISKESDHDWQTRLGTIPVFYWISISVLILALAGCSIKKLAVDRLGNALAEGSSVYASDDDPDLVGAALPFGLKTIEGLLAQSPHHKVLLLAAASGFTQYAYAFVQTEADFIEDTDLTRAMFLRERALRLYRRALGYGIRGLEEVQPGFADLLRSDPARALAPMWQKGCAAPLLDRRRVGGRHLAG